LERGAVGAIAVKKAGKVYIRSSSTIIAWK
jgi:hypothetical protein